MTSSLIGSLEDCFILHPQKFCASEMEISHISDSLILCSQQHFEMSCV